MGFFTDMACGALDLAGGDTEQFLRDMNFSETHDTMRQAAQSTSNEIQFQGNLNSMSNGCEPVLSNGRY